MASLGNQDNNKKKYYEPQVYSPYNVSNTDGVDPSALSYSFFNGLLKISISPMKPGAKPDDYSIWDHDNAIAVWLTHTKARMLLGEIDWVLAHPDSADNGGVNTGNDGLISFSSGKELGASSPCLIIRKVNPDTGEVMSTYAYQFKTDYHKSIRNFNPSDPTGFENYTYTTLEIDQFKTLLKQYYTSICGANAYANMYAERYDTTKMNTKIGLIMDKLGIEAPSDYNNGKGRNNQSFFSSNSGRNAGATGMQTTSMDTLGAEMDE